jgi:hypothetical protein
VLLNVQFDKINFQFQPQVELEYFQTKKEFINNQINCISILLNFDQQCLLDNKHKDKYT